MSFSALTILSLLFALLPAVLFFWNLALYRKPRRSPPRGSVSVLIPARNEALTISECLACALRSEGVDLEVIVLDDHSTDATSNLVREVAARDERVRLEHAPPLPAGWCGKQHACAVLAQLARQPYLCFIDADVRLSPYGLADLLSELRSSNASLISGFPEQITITPLEQLLLPLMHFLLLGYLPIAGMRHSLAPAFGAGCGQLFLAERVAYCQAGGHAAIRSSRHDGLTLPRAFRRAGLRTELCDATDAANCRMYRSSVEVIAGLLKNASEGIASPGRIVPFSLLLLLGQALPLFVLAGCIYVHCSRPVIAAWLAATVACYLPRFAAALRFRQPVTGALLHPFAILFLLVLQWVAFARLLLRLPAQWKGRTYSTP